MNENQWKNQHLSWRAGFGPSIDMREQLINQRHTDYFESLLKQSSKTPGYIEVAGNVFKGLTLGLRTAGKMERPLLTDSQKKEFRSQSRQYIKDLNLRWIEEMIGSSAQLREKMAFFWHGHFACRNLNVFYQQQLLHLIRTKSLDNFGDLLIGVSKSAAMINFLNNNQNRKDHPNENFAREVMELFTMGRGNYTEEDIREAARAFTGWGADINGEFVLRNGQHDNGRKLFLGREGNLSGDDIIEILLEQPATARFITSKIYRFFVNDQEDAQQIEWLAKRFYHSGYKIIELLRDIFTSGWFYDSTNMGNRIKSPIELIVGMQRQIPLELRQPGLQLLVQRLLGQVLFYPPNVSGWPGGKNWIDSASLLLRMQLPQLVAENAGLQMEPKPDDDQQMGKQALNGRNFDAVIEWEKYSGRFENLKKEHLFNSVARFILQTDLFPEESVLIKHTNSSSRQQYISSLTITLMSSPEYQLC